MSIISEVCEIIKKRIKNCRQRLVSFIISDWFLILILQRETCYIFCVQFPHTALTICIYLFRGMPVACHGKKTGRFVGANCKADQ